MKYTSGSVKKGRRTYYYIKNTETGQIESQCTKYLKHKVLQNRAANTVIRIAGILPFVPLSMQTMSAFLFLSVNKNQLPLVFSFL